MIRLIAFFLFLTCTFSYAQKEKITQLENFDNKPLRYGYYLGLHYKGYAIKASNASITPGVGFQLGVLADLHLNNYISVIAEPGVLSSTNKLTLANETIQMPTTHFHLPISFKFTTQRINNVSAYFSTGISYNYNFTAEKNIGDGGAKPNDFVLTKHNFMGEIALGTHFYFPYFKFSPSIRGIYGFNNEYKGLGTTAKNSLNSLKSRAILLTLTFQ
ncbi:hypothetical protein FHR24_000726 [Wenyingzhuangia heitensis]|uniref:Outer membrane protein beta-barrel domain-containing protein n=1 Tax=Wenyingzhuangia heitensis TaxID=1487859 RepID=A0ABX0U617_9FLAO|nr:porin family protein [Wenyingzhuangia heitensis]NIJ44287.1 hypothetical protein [Wenyingzhuangia heitensis]